jgi:hypothetical protein
MARRNWHTPGMPRSPCQLFGMTLLSAKTHYKVFIRLPQEFPRKMICRSLEKVAAKSAANDILVCREILPRRCRAFSATLPRPFPQNFRRIPRVL